jgi:hypothetical protein
VGGCQSISVSLPDVYSELLGAVHGISWLDLKSFKEFRNIGKSSVASQLVRTMWINGNLLEGPLLGHYPPAQREHKWRRAGGGGGRTVIAPNLRP